jgi:type I restriction-modification system DNA methylase subunit
MAVLSAQQRITLEAAVKQARKVAEQGAFNALHAIAADHPEPFAHMSPEQRALRNNLRSKARLLGDLLQSNGAHEISHLGYELAYETWHKMLFAKFLEANHLLMHPDGVSVSMTDCEELSKEEGYADKWEAASSYASRMLPAIFRVDDPLMKVGYAPNDRIKLEGIIEGLENSIFIAVDALGWVYQFWQSEAKAEINANGDYIDGARLPAVTQLFTEPYMVDFLIDNTLGAWWVSRNPHVKPPIRFEYLRLLEDGTPAAGKFEGWPDKTAEVTAMDPCMGSGHFLTSLFPVFASLRMLEEGLSKEQATDRVIAENLYGLELDPRCTQIAAFNLALTAWKFCGHYKELPEMNLACSGIAPKGKESDWVKLVGNIARADDKARMENGMRMLYRHFQLAPELGSLLDPSTIKADAFTASFRDLEPVLKKALENEADTEQLERGVMAAGIAKAGQLLSRRYTLQITNVPYLSRGKQDEKMADYIEKHYKEAKGDLATVFLDKMLKANIPGGITCSVIPQNWLFLTSYKKFREKLLNNESWSLVARLGAKAFQTPMWDFNVMLISISHKKPKPQDSFVGLDVSESPSATSKDEALINSELKTVNQLEQLKNPDIRVVIDKLSDAQLLSSFSNCYWGLGSGDYSHYGKKYWEIVFPSNDWIYQLSTTNKTQYYGGREHVLLWENGRGSISKEPGAFIRGIDIWGKRGIHITQTGKLHATLYTGECWDSNSAPIIPINDKYLTAIWCFCSSLFFNEEVRKIDQKLNVTNATLVKVPFDLEYWQKVASEKYPNGLPKPYSDDPTQWIFHGHPVKSEYPLQISLSRLLGYRWPAESDTEMELSDEARELIAAVKSFDHLCDEDGIFCIPSVNAEPAGSERLRDYLKEVFNNEWNTQTIIQLLQKEGARSNSLEAWLRDEFFIQHCKVFQNRPFIWHIWDGRKDGFSALVSYHKLTKDNLSKLIYTYLGDWIRMCEAKRKAGESGAEGLLSAALHLKERLELILEGESPYDIFVRWKPLEQQPVGWDPDLNDGVRLNIRPFFQADVLRKKPNIKWGIDRGKNPIGSPWGEIRDNDKHLSLEEKRSAQKKA